MSEDVYFRLGERLNQYPMKMLLVDAYLKILREFYTEEQAELGAEFPLGAFKSDELAKTLNRDKEALTDLLENMADNGLIFVTKTKEGVSKYALTQFVPGVVEYQLMRGNDTPKDRKVARMLEEYMMDGEMADLWAGIMSDPEALKEMMPIAPTRTITVEKELPHGKQICSYEKLSEMMDKEEEFATAKCYCRHHAYLLDKPCQVEGVPEYSCLFVGRDISDYIVSRGFGKSISKEEAKEIVLATEKAGLVHNVGNYSDKIFFICNCCGCCCGFLQSMKKFQSAAMVAFSNFGVEANLEECNGCEECIERCQMELLSLKDDVISIDHSLCVGCGNCVSACPTECLSMVRRSETEPPEAGEVLAGMGVGG